MSFFKKILILLGILSLFLIGIFYIYQSYLNSILEEEIAAYHKRMNFEYENCDNVPLNDKEYACKEAQKGDPVAQYTCATYKPKYKKAHHEIPSDEAIELLIKSADQDYTRAQIYLCADYLNWSYYKISRPHSKKQKESCYKAAEKNAAVAQGFIGMMHENGRGVNVDLKEAYFWYNLSNKTIGRKLLDIGRFKTIREKLTNEEIKDIEKRIEQWKPREPLFEANGANGSFKGNYDTKNNPLMPINIAGLACGGEARNCKKTDVCGNLVSFSCYRNKPTYLIINKSSKKVLGECNPNFDYCEDLIPKEWTCPLPNNFPLTQEEVNQLYQKEYNNFSRTNILRCGNTAKIRHTMGNGDTLYYDLTTREKIASCSRPPISRNGRKNCTQPKEWYCD